MRTLLGSLMTVQPRVASRLTQSPLAFNLSTKLDIYPDGLFSNLQSCDCPPEPSSNIRTPGISFIQPHFPSSWMTTERNGKGEQDNCRLQPSLSEDWQWFSSPRRRDRLLHNPCVPMNRTKVSFSQTHHPISVGFEFLSLPKKKHGHVLLRLHNQQGAPFNAKWPIQAQRRQGARM